jgi:hypothetical protein
MELTQELPQPVAPAEPDQLELAMEVPEEMEGVFAEAGTQALHAETVALEPLRSRLRSR